MSASTPNINDTKYMAEAIQLARRGMYSCAPNPRVGCLLVRDDMIIGKGWHAKAGEDHAEVAALRSAEINNPNYITGCTAYVTLEPCCHTGKTPPCVDTLIKAKVARVVVAMIDPNPNVAGNGIRLLEQAGIAVTKNVLQKEAEQLNPGFIKRMSEGKPFVRLKMAASLDGKTALNNGDSQWLTSTAARDDVQHLRARSSALLTGIGTVLADDPNLNVRIDKYSDNKQPLRIILDAALRTPIDAKIFTHEGDVLIVTVDDSNEEKVQSLRSKQTEVVRLPADDNLHINLHTLMTVLAEAEINELMVECGETLAGSFLHAGLVDELVIYLAPHLIGSKAKGLFNLPEISNMQERLALDIIDHRFFGNDLRITAKPIYP